jgi:HAMP domain-containing protein/predicted transcriptional regulator
MKLRLSFAFKILLPFLALAAIFSLIFLNAFRQDESLLSWLAAGGLVFSLVFGFLYHLWLRNALHRIRNLLVQLTRGKLPAFKAASRGDELGDMEQHLEKHVNKLRDIAAFARSMSSGDFTGRYEKLSQDDELGAALISLKGSLMGSMNDSESRRREEENRTWTAQGLAMFSTLFREAEDNLEDLSGALLRELVNYTEADVGALFIAREEEEKGGKILEVAGCYAFDREKYIQRSFRFGEGLTGRAAMEREPIYITDLPPDYMKIRSGLGEDVPSSILLVPVMLDEQVLGVIELASLGEIPTHQVDFVCQLAEALATTLAKVQANLRTKLLFKQTKKQAEELASQEHVFKQKMQALEEAQLKAAAREAELLKEIEDLRSASS